MSDKQTKSKFVYNADRIQESRKRQLHRGIWGLAHRAKDGDAEPLCEYLESPKSLSYDDRKALVWLIWTGFQKGPRGRLSGPGDDLAEAKQIAAALYRIGRDAYLEQHGKQRLRDREVAEQLAGRAIELMKSRFRRLRDKELTVCGVIDAAKHRPSDVVSAKTIERIPDARDLMMASLDKR